MSLIKEEQLYTPGGVRLSRALFKEMNDGSSDPFFTLGRSKDGLPSLRSIFIPMVVEDPTELEFAEYVFGDYSFWVHLTKCRWMEPHLEEWRMIADTKRKVNAFKSIAKEAQGNHDRSALSAARYLIEEPWKDKRSPKTKKAVKGSADKASAAVQNDVVRLKDFMGK